MTNLTLESKLDESVNFVTPSSDGGYYESRYVHRPGTDYVICYLSSHSGCSMGCTMCHLTTSGQTRMRHARLSDLISQAILVLDHAKAVYKMVPKIIFSFMARGEPLLNPLIVTNSTEVFYTLAQIARSILPLAMVNFSISTIMPEDTDLVNAFPVFHPKIYFSAYSANDTVRSQLVPNGAPFAEAAAELVRYTLATKRVCTVHGAFIKGVNDDTGNVENIAEALMSGHIGANIVRYNPPAGSSTEETSMDRLLEIEKIYQSHLNGPVKIVTRVGTDVSASCGMFFRTGSFFLPTFSGEQND